MPGDRITTHIFRIRNAPAIAVIAAAFAVAVPAMQGGCETLPGAVPLLPSRLADERAFVDASARLGDKGYTNGWSGLAAFDADNDGDIDLVVTNGPGRPNRLFQNDGDANFTDIGEAAGIALTPDFSMPCAVGDFNSDGRLDLIIGRQKIGVPAGNAAGPVLFLNEGLNADGIVTFHPTTPDETGFNSEAPAASIGVGDLDNDGLLDLVIGRYDLNATHSLQVPIYDTQPNELWRCTAITDGMPHFEQITIAGIEGAPQKGQSPDTDDQTFIPGTFALYLTDVDNDGFTDIFDLHDIPGSIDYFHNNGDLTFTRLQTNLLNQQGGWMGIAGGDYDSDGDIDYFLTNVGCDFDTTLILPNTVGHAHLNPTGTLFHKLLRNDNGVLTDVATTTPVTPSDYLPPENLNKGVGLEGYEFGFGATWIDADNRGRLDLYWAGDLIGEIGSILRIDSHGIGRFLANNGDGSFTDETGPRGLFNVKPTRLVEFKRSDAARAVAACELNGDGFPDLVLTNGALYGASDPTVRLFINPADSASHWLTVRLVSATSNRFGIGARVLATYDGRTHAAEVVTTTSAFTGVQPEVHFGLGEIEQIETLIVKWPSGVITTMSDVAVNRILTISEGG